MLVDQTLDPMISAYFKNIGQTKHSFNSYNKEMKYKAKVQMR